MAEKITEQLNENFVNELFRLALRNKRVFEVVEKHIKYQFLPNEQYKIVWKEMSRFHNVSQKMPTIGWLAQEYGHNKEVVLVLNDIKEAEVIDKKDALEQFEIFLKNAIFIEAYDTMGDLFVKGDRAEVFSSITKLNEELSNFVIKDTYYDKIFEGVISRHADRLANFDINDNKGGEKVPTGIDEIDNITRGGIDKGDTALIGAQSGIGKSKILKSVGMHAARRGFKVLHVQAEGTRKECLDAYDTALSGVKLHNLEVGNIDKETLSQMKRASKDLSLGGGEIFVESYEQFDTADLQDVRELIQDIIKTYGNIDMLLLDYLELFDPGNGKRYKVEHERQRREALSVMLKNIAVEFNIVIVTATQCSAVDTKLLNDPEFVQTRYNISEGKGLIKPFSYYITLNQTKDEREKKIMRLYMDKVRKYLGGQTVRVYTNYAHERFYNRQKTLKEFFSPTAA